MVLYLGVWYADDKILWTFHNDVNTVKWGKISALENGVKNGFSDFKSCFISITSSSSSKVPIENSFSKI